MRQAWEHSGGDYFSKICRRFFLLWMILPSYPAGVNPPQTGTEHYRLFRRPRMDLHRCSVLSVLSSHLAQNPFMCDCHLKWLADYLFDNPIETSGARCSHPRRLANKRISQVKGKKFRCTGEKPALLPRNRPPCCRLAATVQFYAPLRRTRPEPWGGRNSLNTRPVWFGLIEL